MTSQVDLAIIVCSSVSLSVCP